MLFIQGLNENIKDELATKEYPQSLKLLENLATQVDLHLWTRHLHGGTRAQRAVQPWGESRNNHLTTINTPAAITSSQQLPEGTMQLGRSWLTPEERESRKMNPLCFFCGKEGHSVAKCMLKRPDSVGKRRTLLSHSRHPINSYLFTLPAEIQVRGEKSIPVSTFINSGADTEFIDHMFAKPVGIELI